MIFLNFLDFQNCRSRWSHERISSLMTETLLSRQDLFVQAINFLFRTLSIYHLISWKSRKSGFFDQIFLKFEVSRWYIDRVPKKILIVYSNRSCRDSKVSAIKFEIRFWGHRDLKFWKIVKKKRPWEKKCTKLCKTPYSFNHYHDNRISNFTSRCTMYRTKKIFNPNWSMNQYQIYWWFKLIPD